jgi:hypothetical protein
MSHRLHGRLARRFSPRCISERYVLLIIRHPVCARAHDWFAVQSHSAEIEHVRRSRTQDGTRIRCCFHLIPDPSASRADNVIASFIPYAASAPVVAFHPKHSPSNTTTCKIRREVTVTVAIAIACMVKVELARVARTSAVGHGTGVTRVQVKRPRAQDCIALLQQGCSAPVGTVDARWAEYCRFAVR